MEKHIKSNQESSAMDNYIMPPLSLLNEADDSAPAINQKELEENKNLILKILSGYGIDIDKIEVTPGPSFSLYEIIPLPNVRMSEIKIINDQSKCGFGSAVAFISDSDPETKVLILNNFRNNLNKELGFLPSSYSDVFFDKREKGTLFIEIPNKKFPAIPVRSLLSSEEFQKNDYILPCAIGKNISNETFVFDLSKAPHVIIAGSEDVEKGVNAIITSLLYSKHPSELKFVIIDQKDNYILFNHIGSHYFAKIPHPHNEEAVISYTKEVVRTLNSLCLEMEERYGLLKAAECRNITEYNKKFKSCELQSSEGHRFLPHIVVVIDDIGSLLTIGDDVKSPIMRLVQLARATGIHIIAATHRPYQVSVAFTNKFPARIFFKTDSAFCNTGADKLIGHGDMILRDGSNYIRLQCGFVDNLEIERITKFIGEQSDYSEPYLLPMVHEDNTIE